MKIKEYLLSNGYSITYEDYKIHGSYFGAKKRYGKMKEIELSISDLKDTEKHICEYKREVLQR